MKFNQQITITNLMYDKAINYVFFTFIFLLLFV